VEFRSAGEIQRGFHPSQFRSQMCPRGLLHRRRRTALDAIAPAPHYLKVRTGTGRNTHWRNLIQGHASEFEQRVARRIIVRHITGGNILGLQVSQETEYMYFCGEHLDWSSVEAGLFWFATISSDGVTSGMEEFRGYDSCLRGHGPVLGQKAPSRFFPTALLEMD